jgi:hypothetical protein
MASYVARHRLTAFDQEAALAAELAELLDQRAALEASGAAQAARTAAAGRQARGR